MRSRGRILGLGLLAGASVAVASNRPWAQAAGAGEESTSPAAISTLEVVVESGKAPAVASLALVSLACWGVLLVVRGRLRVAMAALGLVASLGAVLVIVRDYRGAPERVRGALNDLPLVTPGEVGLTWWYWVAAGSALLAILAWVAALRALPDWPEMSRRYDAPGAATSGPPSGTAAPLPGPDRSVDPDGGAGAEPDLWKALDRGEDPTA
jgi:hypothetical protein